MVAGIILVLADFMTLDRKAQSVISLTGVLPFLLTIVFLLYFVSTYEMI